MEFLKEIGVTEFVSKLEKGKCHTAHIMNVIYPDVGHTLNLSRAIESQLKQSSTVLVLKSLYSPSNQPWTLGGNFIQNFVYRPQSAVTIDDLNTTFSILGFNIVHDIDRQMSYPILQHLDLLFDGKYVLIALNHELSHNLPRISRTLYTS